MFLMSINLIDQQASKI